jgi:hypothetical protein
MLHILLTGAGFSRNWGGFLATEAFEFLLGCPPEPAPTALRELISASTRGQLLRFGDPGGRHLLGEPIPRHRRIFVPTRRQVEPQCAMT